MHRARPSASSNRRHTRARLFAVTPPSGSIAIDLVDLWLEHVAHTDVAVILREPGTSPRALLAAHHRLAALRLRCRAKGVACLLACDRGDLVEALKLLRGDRVCGLHIRGDPDPATLTGVRAALPTSQVGRACHGPPTPEALAGGRLVDYSLVAPIFAPRTPAPRVKVPVGLDCLRAWATSDDWPVALGGVSAETAEACVRAGARGLASIRGFFGPRASVAEDVAAFARALRCEPSRTR